jgi:hypothetical protein
LVPLSTLNIEADTPSSAEGSVVAFHSPKKGFGAANMNRADPPSAFYQPGNDLCETDVPF